MFVKCARTALRSAAVSTVDESKRASGSGRITASARCSIRMEALRGEHRMRLFHGKRLVLHAELDNIALLISGARERAVCSVSESS